MMVQKLFAFVCCAAVCLGMIGEARAQLTINLDFSNFNNGAPANSSTILGGASLADARNVIEEAANYWERAFENSSSSIDWASGGNLVQNVTVGWSPFGGSTLAQAGTGWFTPGGQWAPGSATLTWDSDGSSTFFVDTTPEESSEWNQFSERDMTFNGVDVNVERVHYDAPAGATRDNSDMFSVAVHEFGHTLGFLGAFPAFDNADLGNDNDIDITSGPLSGAQIDISGGHTDFLITSPSGGDFPYDPGGNSFFEEFEYGPNVMSPSITRGTRKELTEADIAIVAQFLEFDMNNVNFDPRIAAIPEPATASILVAAAIGLVSRRRRRASHQAS